MADINYEVLNVPRIGREIAASRSERLQPSAVVEYADMLSREVARGDWSTNPEDGQPINSAGQTLPEHLEHTLKTRPHWLMPIDKGSEDEADACWLSSNMTLRSRRFDQITKFCGSDAAARVLYAEEAFRYGIDKPFSNQAGVKPGEVGDKGKAKAAERNLTTNPWSKNFRGDLAARNAQIASIMKQGTPFANALAKAAGTTVGRPLYK
jgi:hypothetical protein